MKYSKEEYIADINFGDRDVDIRCQKIKLVKCKKDHECFFGLFKEDPHDIKAGEIARAETALVDQEFWGSYYICIPCLDKMLDEENGIECGECTWWDYENEDIGTAKCLCEYSGWYNIDREWSDSCDKFKEAEYSEGEEDVS